MTTVGAPPATARAWNLQRHPFYRRWVDGRLSPAELRLYATEHHHAVVAIAEAYRRAAAPALRHRAQAALGRVDLWMQFARAAGWDAHSAWYYGEDPYEQTRALARVWAAATPATLTAIETAQAQVAELLLDGLLEHYAFQDGPATAYFRAYAAAPAGAPDADAARRACWAMLDRLEAEGR